MELRGFVCARASIEKEQQHEMVTLPLGGLQVGRGEQGIHLWLLQISDQPTQTLLSLYRSGKDVERHIAALATYLGHVDIGSTYWCLSAVPELLRLISGRLDGKQEVAL